MKKIISSIISVVFVFAPLSTVTANASVDAQIALLETQIELLQKQIAVVVAEKEVTLDIKKQGMTIGTRGSNVIALQQHLVSEGVLDARYVTGYYGPITDSAVRNLDAKYRVIGASFGTDQRVVTLPPVVPGATNVVSSEDSEFTEQVLLNSAEINSYTEFDRLEMSMSDDEFAVNLDLDIESRVDVDDAEAYIDMAGDISADMGFFTLNGDVDAEMLINQEGMYFRVNEIPFDIDEFTGEDLMGEWLAFEFDKLEDLEDDLGVSLQEEFLNEFAAAQTEFVETYQEFPIITIDKSSAAYDEDLSSKLGEDLSKYDVEFNAAALVDYMVAETEAAFDGTLSASEKALIASDLNEILPLLNMVVWISDDEQMMHAAEFTMKGDFEGLAVDVLLFATIQEGSVSIPSSPRDAIDIVELIETELESAATQAGDVKAISEVKQAALGYELLRSDSGEYPTDPQELEDEFGIFIDNLEFAQNPSDPDFYCVYVELDSQENGKYFAAWPTGSGYVAVEPTAFNGCGV